MLHVDCFAYAMRIAQENPDSKTFRAYRICDEFHCQCGFVFCDIVSRNFLQKAVFI